MNQSKACQHALELRFIDSDLADIFVKPIHFAHISVKIVTKNCHVQKVINDFINVRIHRPPAVTLNETLEEFHIFLDYVRRFKSNLLQKVSGH
jgi:hypothetical protein